MASLEVFAKGERLDFGEKDTFGLAGCFGAVKKGEDGGVDEVRDVHLEVKGARQ